MATVGHDGSRVGWDADGRQLDLPPYGYEDQRRIEATARDLATAWLQIHRPDVSVRDLEFVWLTGEACGCCGAEHNALLSAFVAGPGVGPVPRDCRDATDDFYPCDVDDDPVAFDQNGEVLTDGKSLGAAAMRAAG